MPSFKDALKAGKSIRVIGFDDAPFKSEKLSSVKVSGVICSNTRFEGMLWGEVQKDGSDATSVFSKMILDSKFHDQIHLVLIDGIAVGGFNVLDLENLSLIVDRPCVSVMRRVPDMNAINKALENLEDGNKKYDLILSAGKVYELDNFVFQVCGASPQLVVEALSKLTDRGNVPEALRLAHLIGAAVMMGQSSGRA
ncbi:DUF99 family protein [Agarilytica rhodophyticola]|uniref:endonuclease dU n=1 Tax=Agarilytica rhodophyticola TaxID=1737490 RepID=UPI000B34671C|nr:DUF99 family protein [Agarilytica rhodophyticola]